MLGHRDEVDGSTEDVLESVTAALATVGWVRRDLGTRVLATFTRELPGDLLLGAEVDRTSFSWPQDWPAELSVRVGVGTEAALALMPLLTLRHSPLVLDLQSPDQPRFSVSWANEREGSNVVRRLVRHIEATSEALAARYPDVDAVLRDLRDRRATAHRHYLQRELTLLTGSGRRDDARDLLGTYIENDLNASERRFVRQLTRWLDSGRLTVPPLADTLAVLPPEGTPPRFSLSDTRAKSKARRAALDATRAQSRGKTQAELAELLTTEYGRRGLQSSPGIVAQLASILHAEQRPFGRALSALAAVKALKAFGTDGVRLVKTAVETTTPDWLLPPERASYPVRGLSRSGFVPVTLDAEADAWLTRVSETVRSLGSVLLVDVWLTVEPGVPERLVAHVGPRRVGVISPTDVASFEGVLRAAALFDEDPLLSGHLSRPPGSPGWLLEVQKPHGRDDPPPA